MDKKAFDERADRLKEVNEVVSELDPAIRSQAFDLLAGYVDAGHKQVTKVKEESGEQSDGDDELFSRFPSEKPAGNVYLIAAWHYQQYGSAPFTIDEVKTKADGVGLTIPARPDATLNSAKKGGKAMFSSTTRGTYKPTVSAETYFKDTYQVKKGTRSKPSNGDGTS